MASETVHSNAVLSNCGRYRYMLSRKWGPRPSAWFVTLNPSTADHEQNDPTILRCMDFARSWGCGGVNVVNLYAWRATIPSEMFRAQIDGLDIVGEENDYYLRACRMASFEDQTPVVAAWGNNARSDRVAEVLEILGPGLQRLGFTNSGAPKHPLARGTSYIPKGTKLRPYPEPKPEEPEPPPFLGWLSLEGAW